MGGCVDAWWVAKVDNGFGRIDSYLQGGSIGL
jgi:hypothetical protein